MERVECYSLSGLSDENLLFVLNTVSGFNRELNPDILKATVDEFIVYKPNTETFSVSSEPLEGCESIDKIIPIKGVDFGKAMEALKEGKKVTREGWNGKETIAYYVPGGVCKTQTEETKKVLEEGVKYRPYLSLKTIDNDVYTWSPSSSDILAEDWVIKN